MNLLFRTVLTWILARFAPKAELFDPCSTSFRVLPTDIDVLGHMNNGRYLSLADIARLDFLVRCQIFSTLNQHHAYAVVASEMIRFRRSINLFTKFELVTQLMGWDDKFFYILHQYKRKHTVHALALVKVRFIRRGGESLDTLKILKMLEITTLSPTLPPWIKSWHQVDQDFYDSFGAKHEHT